MGKSTPSRRTVLAGAAAGLTLGTGALSSCSRADSGGSSGKTAMKFWDQPWGQQNYVSAATDLVTGYTEDNTEWSYQQVSWNNFYQVYSSAVASGTNPAVSTGGGFQAYGLAEEGAIHYADNVVAAFESSGKIDDFLPGLIDALKTDDGYTGIPWAVDCATLYYSKPLLEENGLPVPTSWDDLYNNGLALKAKGISGLVIGSGSGNDCGHQSLLSFMHNNAGGIFDPDQKLDLLYERNVEAVNFVIELVKEGIVSAGASQFNVDSMDGVWKNGQGAAGFRPPNYASRIGPEGTILVNSPLTGPNGDKGALRFINSVMMYENSPSIEAAENFVEWYTTNNSTYFTQKLASGLPVLQSTLDLPEEKSNTEQQKILDEWIPVASGTGGRSENAFAALALIDGSQPFYQFAQTVLQGETTAEAALQTFQDQLDDIING